MILRSLITVAAVLTAFAVSIPAQQQATGTVDYSLANSSVMWTPGSASIFLNPGELARLHQNEFMISSGRFRSLESMSSAIFVPGTGTIGIGVTPTINSSQYGFGFGGLLGNYNTVGGALSVLPKVERSIRLSFGGALHLPAGGEETGGHAGISITNVLSKVVLRAGAGYWLLPRIVRLQIATQSGMVRAELLGLETRVLEGVHIQVGTRGFTRLLAGASYTMPYATVAIGAGPEGLSFTVNARIGDAAADVREEAFDQGNEALVDQRFGDARESFLNALRYDEYDNEVRLLAEKSRILMDSSVTALLRQANENEGQHNYTEAMRAYAQVLKIDPQQTVAASSLANVEQKLRLYVQRLLVAGDSLKGVHDLTRARKSYELALELDPENDSASVRIDELESLSKENVRSMLLRARSLLRKNQLDDSQKEYERILSIESTNTQALSGLRAVNNRRVNEQLAVGKVAYEGRKYLEALQIFSDIVQKEENNKEAKQLLEKTRGALRSDVERLFKTGLQFYIKEDFKSAIATWDKVLMIQPEDSSTREYRKRAEEKLKALEQFK